MYQYVSVRLLIRVVSDSKLRSFLNMTAESTVTQGTAPNLGSPTLDVTGAITYNKSNTIPSSYTKPGSRSDKTTGKNII